MKNIRMQSSLILLISLFFIPLISKEENIKRIGQDDNNFQLNKEDPILVYLSKEDTLNEDQYRAITCFTDDCVLKRIETKIDDLTDLSESCCDISHNTISTIDELVNVTESCCENTGSNLDSLTELVESCCEFTNSSLDVLDSLIDRSLEIEERCCEYTNSALSDLTALTESCCDANGSTFESSIALVESCCEYTNSVVDALTDQNISCCEATGSNLDSATELIESCCEYTNSAIDALVDQNVSCCDHTGSNLDSLTELIESCCEYSNSLIDVNTSLLESIAATSSCGITIDQAFVDGGGSITSSGVYCLVEDISFVTAAALTIDADNVTLDLNNHTISGISSNTAISIAPTIPRFNITIENGILFACNIEKLSTITAIQHLQINNITIGGSSSSAGIELFDINGVRMDNVYVGGQSASGDGILLHNIIDGYLNNLFLEANAGNGLEIEDNSFNICINNSKSVNNQLRGFSIDQRDGDSAVTDVTFYQCLALRNQSDGFSILINTTGAPGIDLVNNINFAECIAKQNGLSTVGSGFSINVTGVGIPANVVTGTVYNQCLSQDNNDHGFSTLSSEVSTEDSIQNTIYNQCISEGNGTLTTDHGFSLLHDNITVKNSYANGNSGNGIIFTADNGNAISCTTNNNGSSGVECTSATTNISILNIESIGNTLDGILVNGTNVLVKDSIASGNSQHGINFDSSSSECTALFNQVLGQISIGAIGFRNEPALFTNQVRGTVANNNTVNYGGAGTIENTTNLFGGGVGPWVNADL